MMFSALLLQKGVRVNHDVDITSTPVGAWKCNFPSYLGNYDRQNYQPASQQPDMKVQREVTLPMSRGLLWGVWIEKKQLVLQPFDKQIYESHQNI